MERKREIITTGDGSKTIYFPNLDENYHSKHGALQEAMHVFINHGLNQFSGEVSVFEVGLGTMLNAFLSAYMATQNNLKVSYTGIELFPISKEEITALEYDKLFDEHFGDSSFYNQITSAPWQQEVIVNDHFKIVKLEQALQNIHLSEELFDIIYFDAFAPRVQPEMWTVEVFDKLYKSLKKGGFLITYCAKGQVKRNLKSAGFHVEALPGPPGKREMTRAVKV